jgi:8-oxo-dGTP pyrophosphatase MutT (NUDIX family)
VQPPGPLRLSAKAFLVDGAGRLLLLDCADPDRPGVRWWELPGGGVEPGEDEVEALVREVLEETGLRVDPAAVGPLQWTQESTFVFRSVRRWSRCHGRVVRLPEAGAAAATVLTDDEQGSILGARWWSPQELAAPGARFFPRGVPALLPRVLAGERVDEPFDVWD